MGCESTHTSLNYMLKILVSIFHIFIRFQGHGILYFTNGGKFEADWENGMAVGLGTGVSGG